MLSLPFIYMLAEEERALIRPNEEYAQVGLFDLDDIANGSDFHPALRKMAYDTLARLGR